MTGEGDIDELAVVAAAADRISVLARSSDLSTPVDHLSRWKIRDVVAHLGGVHRWATRIVDTRSRTGPGFTKSKLDGLELCDWYDAGVAELLDTFRRNDRHGECPNFNPGSENTVGWWARRQMHETNVHRWDIEHVLGETTPFGAAVSTDGIDEFLDVFVRTRGKQTLTAPLLLATTDPAHSWTLSPAKKPGRVDVNADGVTNFACEVSGEPEHLLLALWRGAATAGAELSIKGDHDVASSLVGPV